MDLIEIDNLRLRCIIGFSPHERKDRQDVVISLRIGTDMTRPGQSDNPDDAFNYRTVTKAIIEHVEASEYFLVEKLAVEIARLCVVDFQAPTSRCGSINQARCASPIRSAWSSKGGPVTSPDARVYLSLGSNIDPEANLKAAIRLLQQQTRVLALSSVYRSAPQGFADQADFLNMAVLLRTALMPGPFKQEIIAGVEAALGRLRDPGNKNAPRTIDLDIALWDDAVFDYGAKPWHIPDPDIPRFAHVAVPLADLAPDYIHPESRRTLAQIAAALDSSTLRRVALDFDPIS